MKIYDASADQEGKGDAGEIVARIKKSGNSVRLHKDVSYIVSYRGNEGFESGHKDIDLSSKNSSVTINPYYSDKRLAALLEEELNDIHAALAKKYPRVNLYEIQKGKLYHFGDWYGTTLRYIGNDLLNSDSLRVVLHKNNGVWRVSSNPPNVSLDKFTYPNIPHDVLSSVNNEIKTPPLYEPESAPSQNNSSYIAPEWR